MNFFQGGQISSINYAGRIYTSETDHVRFRPRTFHGFVFYLSGRCEYVYPEKPSFYAEKDMFLYLPKGIIYEIHPPEKSSCILIDVDTVNEVSFPAFAQQLYNAPQIRDCFISAANVFRQKKIGYMAELMSLVYRIIALVQSAQKNVYLPLATYARLEPAVNYIAANYMDPDLRVSGLAQLCNVSERYFSQLFLACYGTSPKKYILNRRIELARTLLSTGIMPVKQIAERCGFTNAYYFSRIFREIVMLSPSEYRRISIY